MVPHKFHYQFNDPLIDSPHLLTQIIILGYPGLQFLLRLTRNQATKVTK
jgi:hypothetical protein